MWRLPNRNLDVEAVGRLVEGLLVIVTYAVQVEMLSNLEALESLRSSEHGDTLARATAVCQ